MAERAAWLERNRKSRRVRIVRIVRSEGPARDGEAPTWQAVLNCGHVVAVGREVAERAETDPNFYCSQCAR